MLGRTLTQIFRSDSVPGDVPATIYLPPGYDDTKAAPFPLLLLLHGGNGSEQDLLRFAPVVDRMIAGNQLAPVVVVTPGARRSLYMDYRDGSERWETFILLDLLPKLRQELNVLTDRKRTFVAGWSMGGLGSLRLAFKHPDVFGAIAAVEPAVEAAASWDAVGPRVKFWRPDALYETIFGSPVDEMYWAANSPAAIARAQPDRLNDLGIYLEVGDQDMLCLNEGVEFLHRILFDVGIAHEYRLVRGADHIGPSLEPRIADALSFIARQIDPPDWIDFHVIQQRSELSERKKAVEIDAK